MTCSVQSYSHKLNKEAFSLLTTGKSNIFASDINEESFLLSFVNTMEDCKTIDHFATIGHLCLSYFIMALNIATLGHFTWEWNKFAPPLYKIVNPQHEGINAIIGLQLKGKGKENVENIITEKEIRNAFLLFIALGKEGESNVRKEYLKGILHLSLDFYDIDFHREAFGNFYRSFESFATERVLKVRKLQNELKELQKVIINFSKGNTELAEAFRDLYKLRSGQIMHAQKKQFEIKKDDVLKMKVILDLILHKVYQPVWEKVMKDFKIQREMGLLNNSKLK